MFHYISSGAIIILELVCCNIFFESFCDERSGQKKWRKVLLAGVFFVLDYACILLLAQNFILKQIAIICLFMIIMYLYYKVSIGKALVLSALYQGLLLFVDYIAYIVNSSIFLKKTVLQTSETLTKSLIIVFGKILLFLCVLSKRKSGKNQQKGWQMRNGSAFCFSRFLPLLRLRRSLWRSHILRMVYRQMCCI